jgi:hypothetical protein
LSTPPLSPLCPFLLQDYPGSSILAPAFLVLFTILSYFSSAVTLYATVCCLQDLEPRRVSSEIPLSSSVSRARERACASVALQVTHYFLAMDLLWVSSTMIMADDASAFIGTEHAYQYTHVAVWGKIHAYTVYSSLMQKITEHSQYTP